MCLIQWKHGQCSVLSAPPYCYLTRSLSLWPQGFVTLYCHPWACCARMLLFPVGGNFHHLNWLKMPFMELTHRQGSSIFYWEVCIQHKAMSVCLYVHEDAQQLYSRASSCSTGLRCMSKSNMHQDMSYHQLKLKTETVWAEAHAGLRRNTCEDAIFPTAKGARDHRASGSEQS